MKKNIIILAWFLVLLPMFASAQLAMGKWRTHFAYNSVTSVAQTDNKVFAVSDGALFSVDKLAGEAGMEFYSKITGLNGTGIKQIKYDSSSKQLLIVYSNGNMDVYASGGITNIPDLYLKQMSSSKGVNQVTFYQDKAYLSCDFGIVVMNMAKKEVADTYYIGTNGVDVKVLSTAINNGNIYAASAQSIYTASATEPMLVNFEFWSTLSNLPGSGNIQSVLSFAGKLFMLRNSKLYTFDNNVWTNFRNELTVNSIVLSNNKLIAIASGSVYAFDDQLASTELVIGNTTVSDVEYDPTNSKYWFAGNSAGIVSYEPSATGTPIVSYFKPNGPAVNMPFDMKFAGKKLFVVPGGRWEFEYHPGNIMMFENNIWKNINFATSVQPSTNQVCTDVISIAVDPKDSAHFFAASYSSGLYEFRNNTFYKYHYFGNSAIEVANVAGVAPGSYQYQMLGGTIFDSNNNLWVLNQFSQSAIKVLLSTGEWTQLTYPNLHQPGWGGMLISNLNKNQKWMYLGRGKGLMIFDDNGTITDQSDDKSIFLSSFVDPDKTSSYITPANFFSFAQDKNGVVWVGTEQGPLLFSNPSKAFDAGFTCSRVKISRNDSTNLADYLLVNEKIKTIVIDGANRKWLGTESSGVYLMSENGQETIHHFDVSNSPLLSNSILSIAINPVTGEVFIGTDKGLLSYQSDAGEGGETFGDVHAYPNPVREGYAGLITITGLIANTQVKITDINGNLVCETVSNGSLATWNGKDVHGRKVSTGVYLAVCVNEDGTQNTITKILVIN